MRYQRASADSTLHAAKQAAAAHRRIMYVYATALGFTIEWAPPPSIQAHYVVDQDRTATFVPAITGQE